MIKADLIKLLRKGKNLLAFSYGSDSTALFYLLLKENIDFDLAFVNYGLREQSKEEEKKALELALKFNKQIFISHAPKFKGNFEQNARNFRYKFFETLCLEKGFENLVLAHQLNDKFEWFLMQLSKGAGLLELLGMKQIEKRANFTLLRPLLDTSKDEIEAFLKQEGIFYFKDESNEDEKYLRNHIRKHFAKEFISEFAGGVKRSFIYLQKDLQNLLNDEIREFEGILICEKNESVIAKALKQKGVLMSAKQRKQALKKDCVISGKIAICYVGDKALIFAWQKALTMPKAFKEECRLAKIPTLLRPYAFEKSLNLKLLQRWIQD